MSGRRRSPAPPPRPYADEPGRSYRDDRGGPSSGQYRRRRSPSPNYSSSRSGQRDWRRDDWDVGRRDGGYSGRSERDDLRSRDRDRDDYRSRDRDRDELTSRNRDRDERYRDPPPRSRPSAYDKAPISSRRHGSPRDASRRSRSPPPHPPKFRFPSPQPPKLDAEEQEEGEEEEGEEDAMAAMMGFGGFGTTKGKKVAGNDAGAAEIKKERTWRQYMNRKGGFNRPLDKIK